MPLEMWTGSSMQLRNAVMGACTLLNGWWSTMQKLHTDCKLHCMFVT